MLELFLNIYHSPSHPSVPGCFRAGFRQGDCRQRTMQHFLSAICTRVQPRSSLGTPAWPSPNKPEIAWAGTLSSARQCSLLAAPCLFTHRDTDQHMGSRVEVRLVLTRLRIALEPFPLGAKQRGFFFRAGKAAPSCAGQAHFCWQPPVGTKENKNY